MFPTVQSFKAFVAALQARDYAEAAIQAGKLLQAGGDLFKQWQGGLAFAAAPADDADFERCCEDLAACEADIAANPPVMAAGPVGFGPAEIALLFQVAKLVAEMIRQRRQG